MKWLFRPSILVLVSAALALSAVTLVLWPRALENKAVPLPVEDGDQEIVWLYAATSPGPWERFVRAVGTVVDNQQTRYPDLGMEMDDGNAFPAETTAVPEVVVSGKGNKGRLRFRWYKLTSDLKTQDWVQALLERRPAPLAIIGGSSSDLGIELARSLKAGADERNLGPASPLLLLTMATADDDPSAGDRPLSGIYAGRTFRFCFTNRQMAEAVIDFIWGQNELRPDGDPVYLTYWNDDPYSKDLTQRYLDALQLPAAQAAAQDWARLAGSAAAGSPPLDGVGVAWGQFRLATPPHSASIPYSVGSFARPNRWEVEEAGRLMKTKLEDHPQQRRPLLVLPAATQPARRFLRALVRFAPVEARRFVVATGDAISFNTVYRDRNVAWPIQDLPFSLVFFCHRNPVERAAGFPLEASARASEPSDTSPSPAGTEDLLLYADILGAVIQCSFRERTGEVGSTLPANADELKRRLGEACWCARDDRVCFERGDQPLFDDKGNRRSGTGEHVVYVRPTLRGQEMVLPVAKIDVWSWQAANPAVGRLWRRQATLPVHYDGYYGQDSDQ